MVSRLKKLAGIHARAHAASSGGHGCRLLDDGAAIEIRGVSYSYDKDPFIENLSLDIPHGQVTSIVGPNGCGKSTLLKIVDGLLEPHAGDVLIGGIASQELGSKERARILALLAQGIRPPAMSVEALVTCGRYPYQGHLHRFTHEDRRHVEEAMALAGIERFRNHDVRHLSGGERQRAYIAMVLAQDTDYIALDEPTTYLDVGACHEIMQLVCELNRTAGKTIIMVIHDLDLALRYSDHMVVMERGACLFSGATEDALASRSIEEAFKVEVRHAPVDGRAAYALFPLDRRERKGRDTGQGQRDGEDAPDEQGHRR